MHKKEKSKALTQEEFKKLYKREKTPWDLGRPDFNLVETVTNRPIQKCKALDIGSGSGRNAIWLTQQGFEVTGVDTADIALQKAKENASEGNVKCTFLLMDFQKDKVPGAPFGFVFDRGCFHLNDSDDGRMKFAKKVAYYLKNGGLWLSIIGSADEPPRGPGPLAGPPRRSARDVVAAVEQDFEILSLNSSHFESNRSNPPRAWACLMRKRDKHKRG